MIDYLPTLNFPLNADLDGAIYVSATRLTLDTLIARYYQGDTPEAIYSGFPKIPVDDIYAAIACYLAHRDILNDYLKHRVEDAESIQYEVEASYTLER